MDIYNNKKVELKRTELTKCFTSYAKDINQHYLEVKSNITKWSYSLGITEDLIPFENLIPSVILSKNRKSLPNPSKANFESKNLVTYGRDKNGNILLMIRKYNKDVEKFGENVRYVDCINGKKVIVNAHIYDHNPTKSRLCSLCDVYEEDGLVYYVSVTPPNDWYVRVDELHDNKIVKVSMFATSWFKQMDFNLFYDHNSNLSKVMVGDHLHWESNL